MKALSSLEVEGAGRVVDTLELTMGSENATAVGERGTAKKCSKGQEGGCAAIRNDGQDAQAALIF